MPRLLAFALMILPGAALSQVVCDAPQPSAMPPCLVGAWYGENNALEKMEPILASLPANVRAQITGSIGQYMSIAIYEDGFYSTLPISGQVDGQIRSGDEVATFEMDLEMTAANGWLWATDDGLMTFCTNPGSGVGIMQQRFTDGGGTTTNTIDSAAAMDTGFVPPMHHSCADDFLMIDVDLPDPIGTITYFLDRIPLSAMSPDLRAAHAARFGG